MDSVRGHVAGAAGNLHSAGFVPADVLASLRALHIASVERILLAVRLALEATVFPLILCRGLHDAVLQRAVKSSRGDIDILMRDVCVRVGKDQFEAPAVRKALCKSRDHRGPRAG